MKFYFSLATKIRLLLLFVFLSLVGCGGGGGGGAGTGTETGTVSVTPSFAVTSQPVDQVVEPGASVKFSVVATGAASYQWQTLENNLWSNLSGGNSPDLSIANVTIADSGKQYRVNVVSAANTQVNITSSVATLTVSAVQQAPAVSVQPNNLTLTAGQSGAFAVTATGTSLQYLWQTSVDGNSWTDTGTPSSPSFSVADAAITSSGKLYRAIISNSLGSVTTNAALLTVLPIPATPTISAQTTNVSVTVGQEATFLVLISGNPAPTFQWQTSSDGSAWTNIIGANSSIYTIAATAVADSGHLFRLVASNTAGTATSSAVQLTVTPANQAPTITSQPTDLTVTAPATATFTVAASGTPTPSYQWQVSTDRGSTYANINGAISASYSISPTTYADNNKRYRVLVSNVAGAQLVPGARLTVNPAPVVSTTSWSLTTSTPQAQNFTWFLDLVFNNLGIGIAVGYDSGPFIARSTDYGMTWSKLDLSGLSSSASVGMLHTAAFVDSSTVLAAGDYGTMLRSTDGGKTWTEVPSNTGPATEKIVGIAFSPDTHTGIAVTLDGVMVRTVDAGATWTKLTNVPSLPYRSVAFGSDSVVIAVGGDVVGQGNTVLRSTDGGVSWTRINVGLSGGLTSIAFSSPTTAVTVGDGILLSTDAGLTWTYPQDQPFAFDHRHTDVVFSSGGVGLIVSPGVQTYASNGAPNAIPATSILRSIDGGQSWSKDLDVTSDFIGPIQFADVHSPIALGSGTKIFRGIGY
ncbi:Ycf48-like protein [Comamonadaceae bacterium OS-1]|nr:Ycf48-like protein [Comamonadaceae bacterium OS-1]